MSFFFAEAAEASGGKKNNIPLHTARELGCKVCPLKAGAINPDMPPDGHEKPIFYFLGEAPGESEDKQNRPFVGKSGQLLRSHIPADIQDQSRFNNVVRSRPPLNRKPEPVEIECCRKSIEQDIEKTQPFVIIAVGAVALHWLLGESDISKWRGRFFPLKIGKYVCWGYAIYHPSYILRNQRTSQSGNIIKTEWDHIFKFDLDYLYDTVDSIGDPYYIDSGHLHQVQWTEGLKADRELDKVLKWLDEMSQSDFVGFDYETNCLRPFEHNASILTVALANDKMSIAFPIEYPNAWSDAQLQKLKAALVKFFQSPAKKICHNVKFEMEWTGSFFGNDLIYHPTWHDTQAQAYVLDERRGMLSLDNLTRLNFGFWLKNLSNLDRSRMASYPLEKILPYNGLDAKWTRRLFFLQKKKVDADKKLKKVYKNLLETAATLTATQIRGVCFDHNHHAELTKQYQTELDEIIDKIGKLPEVDQFKNRFNITFNPGSPDHILRCFRTILGVDNELKTDTGKYSTNEATLSTLKEYELANLILDYRGIVKKISTYLEPYPAYANTKDGRIHTNFNPYETTTGRLCVAKGTLIETVRDYSKLPEGVPIEDVKIGDYVYTYDDNLQIVVKPVIDAGIAGHKRVMRIHWQGDGHKTTGYLDVTCNHPIRLINGEYVRADHLRKGDRILSLTRTIKGGRSFFYQTGRKKIISDQRFIYEQFNGKITEHYDVHHKDHNTLNNTPDNLEILSNEDHARHHAKIHWSNPKNVKAMLETRNKKIKSGEIIIPSGENHYAWKHLSRYQTLKLIVKSYGDITKLNIDYHTFLRKCEHHKIDYKHCCMRFSKKGCYISKARMLNLAKEFGPTKTSRQLHIDYTKLTLLLRAFDYTSPRSCAKFPSKYALLRALAKARGRVGNLKGRGFSDLYKVKKYAEIFGIDLKTIKNRYTQAGKYVASTTPNNHRVIQIELLPDTVDVYDLVVENTHNFIAGGLCIHNSSDTPNLQNLPNKTGKEIRRMIVAPKDHWMVCSDYGQIEARIIGVASQDEEFCKALWEDYDVHMHWAEVIANEHPKVIGGSHKLNDKAAMKKFRAAVKNLWVFPAFYGASPHSISRGIGVPIEIVLDIFREFWQTFRGVKRWQKWILQRYEKLGYVETLSGRRRHAPMTMNAALNASIQGFASDICVDAMDRLDRLGIQTVMQIHDDVTSNVKDSELEAALELIAEQMCLVPYPFINVPIAVEISVGPNWFDQEPVGTFKSTDFHKVPNKLQDFTKLYDVY